MDDNDKRRKDSDSRSVPPGENVPPPPSASEREDPETEEGRAEHSSGIPEPGNASKHMANPAKAGNGVTNQKSRFTTKTRNANKVYPFSSPEELPRTNLFSSQADLSDEAGFVVPIPRSVSPQRKRLARATPGTGPTRAKEFVMELKSSPGRTQVPTENTKGGPFSTGIQAPNDILSPEKSLRHKKRVLNFGAGGTATQPRFPAVLSSGTPSSTILDKKILAPHEVPKSKYLSPKVKPKPEVPVTAPEEPIQVSKPKPRLTMNPKLKFLLRSAHNEEAAEHPAPSVPSIPKMSPNIKLRLANRDEAERLEYRQNHLKHLHAKYTWKRFYTMVKPTQGQKEEAAAERAKKKHEAQLEEIRKRKAEKRKRKKPKIGFLAKLIKFFDEDENLTSESSSEDSETELRKRMSFQQMTLGERRKEIRMAEHSVVVVDKPESHLPLPMKNRKESKVIKRQQVSAAVRRVNSGGSLGLDIPAKDHPLKAGNIEAAPNYEVFAKRVRTSLPSGYALPHDDAIMRLFDQLVPLLKESGTELEEERIEAAADAFDEFRVAKLHWRKKSGGEPERRLSDIRFLPGNLEQRRGVMTSWEDSRAQDILTLRRRVQDSMKLVTGRFGEWLKGIELWHESIHQIEMNFGVSAATYFRWLRSVILLNTLYSIFSLTFIVIPEIIQGRGESLKNLTLKDLFLAENIRHRANFFYGAYKYVPIAQISNPFESTALRFVLVLTLITLMDTFFIGFKVRTYYKRLIAKVSDSDKTGGINFFALFLSAWDYSLTSERAVKVQQQTIARDFNNMMDVYERQLKGQEENDNQATGDEYNVWSWTTKWSSLIFHWTINLLVLAMAGGFGFLMYTILALRGQNRGDPDSVHWSVQVEVTSSIVIGIALNIISPFCAWLTSFETYNTVKEKVFVLVYRIGFFYISVCTVLYIFWITNSLQPGPDHCWEEDTGTEIYRLLVFEGITNAIATFIRYVLYPAIKAKCTKRKFEKSVFDVEYFTLDLIFVHTLSGVGTFFFPLLPLVAIARLLVSFYWMKFVLSRFCDYPTYQLHPSEIFAPYLFAFFCSYLCVIFSNSWLMSEEKPSMTCGPFQGYTNDTYSRVFHLVVHAGVGNFTGYIVSPWFLYFAVIILGAVVYTFRAWTHAYFDTMNLLHDLLRLERIDREFLLRAMYSIPGIEAPKGSNKTGSGGSGGPGEPRDRGNTETELELFMQQQEALAHLFDDVGGEDAASFRSHDSGSGSGGSAENIPGDELTELPTERAKKDIARRRHRHLKIAAKSVRLLSRHTRRFSVAGKIYMDVVGKALGEMSEEGRK